MNPRDFLLVLFAALCLCACTPDDPTSVDAQIHAAFRDLKQVHMMKSGEEYAVEVAGEIEHGTKEMFLRRRGALEIWSSGLSSGCGDYAFAFIHRMSEYGVSTLMIDAAELSQRSLDSRFAGHSVVAVQVDQEPPRWWLVDPAARKVLSRDWDPEASQFRANGKRFWIGFCGAVDDYPVDSPEGLRAFYDRTLDELPHDVLLSISADT